MATNIKLKSSSVTGKTPTLSDLSLRELAVNTVDGKLFLRKGDGSGTDKIIDVTGPLQASEPMGHEDKSQSTISFNSGTRVFTIQPVSTSFNVWCKGVKYTYTTAQTVTIPSGTTGLYYIYFDADGVLQYRTSYFDWENDAPTAYVYWNATTGTAPFVADERHGIVLDWATHEYLHRTRGAVIANGFSISNYSIVGDGSSDDHIVVDIGDGTFFDEDLKVNITHSNTPTIGTFTQVLTGNAEIPIFYQSGTSGSWVIDTATIYPIKYAAGERSRYNQLSGGNWVTTQISNNQYGVTFIVATNDINAPIIGLLGQQQFVNIGNAEEYDFSSLDLPGFPIVEFRPLYKLIYQTADTYTNTPKTRLVNVLDLRGISAVAGNGLDADTVDGIQAASFLRSDANDSASGTYTFSGGGSDASNTPTFDLTAGYISVPHDEVLLKFDQGQKMITSNDGQGNFNIRGGHDNDALHVNSDVGDSGMSAITLDSDGQDGSIHLIVGPRRAGGSSATADWGLSIERGSTGLKWKTGSATHGASLATVYTVWHSGNDGSGSGLDADLLDGQQGSYYQPASTALTTSTQFGGDVSGTYNAIVVANDSHTHDGRYYTEAEADGRFLGINAKASDSHLLDGIDSGSFLRSDANDSFSGNLTNAGNNYITFGPNSSWGAYLRIGGNGYQGTTGVANIAATDGNLHLDAAPGGSGTYLNYYAGTTGVAFGNGASGIVAWMGADGDLWKGGNDNTGSKYWHAGNDGSGSGLDADLLDGLNSGSFLRTDANTTFNASGNDLNIDYDHIRTLFRIQRSGVEKIRWSAAGDDINVTLYNSATYNLPSSTAFGNNTNWHGGSDGAGSGLDADLLDGQQGSYYLNTSATTQTKSGGLNVSGNVGIGTANPSYKLSVLGDFRFTSAVSLGTTSGDFLTLGDFTYNNGNQSYIRFKATRLANGTSWVTTSNKILCVTDVTEQGYIEFNPLNGNSGIGLGNGSSEYVRINAGGNVGIGTTNPQYKLEVNGSFAATTKSFIIPHPTKPDHKLRYGSLEGPENGVYVRGRSKEFIIELPDYWTKLVDPDSITVNLTSIGKTQTLWVKDIKDNKIYIGSKCSQINYFYMIFAERSDVEKLEVEFPIG